VWSKDKRQFGKVFMSLDRDRDPLLVIWEEMNLFAEVNMYLDAPKIKKLLSDAAGVVCRLTMELAMRAKLQDPFESNKITLHYDAIGFLSSASKRPKISETEDR
jgi:hypothetical protein